MFRRCAVDRQASGSVAPYEKASLWIRWKCGSLETRAGRFLEDSKQPVDDFVAAWVKVTNLTRCLITVSAPTSNLIPHFHLPSNKTPP